MDPITVMAIADKGVDIADKTVDVAGKGIELIDEHKAREQQRKFQAVKEGVAIGGQIVDIATTYMQNKQEMQNEQRIEDLKYLQMKINVVNDIAEMAPGIVRNVANAGSEFITAVIMAKNDFTRLKDAFNLKDHGSKVKMGMFAECSIERYADRACIVDKDNGLWIALTSENVKECRYLRKKYKVSRGKKYYYYEIIFANGSSSYVRMSKKYRECLEKYVTIIDAR